MDSNESNLQEISKKIPSESKLKPKSTDLKIPITVSQEKVKQPEKMSIKPTVKSSAKTTIQLPVNSSISVQSTSSHFKKSLNPFYEPSRDTQLEISKKENLKNSPNSVEKEKNIETKGSKNTRWLAIHIQVNQNHVFVEPTVKHFQTQSEAEAYLIDLMIKTVWDEGCGIYEYLDDESLKDYIDPETDQLKPEHQSNFEIVKKITSLLNEDYQDECFVIRCEI